MTSPSERLPASVSRESLVREYAAALAEYLSGAGEAALTRAYELGRAAVLGGLGVVDMVALHEQAVRNDGVIASRSPQAAQFLAESLSPFEMTHRGFREANVRLEQAISDLREKNRELAATARELLAAKEATERANRDLEAFSYSVSHDLRAPLRSIDGFSLALLEDCADQLDATGIGHLKRVRVATGRMSELIDDLLEFSRVTQAALHCARVDLSDMAQEIISELRTREPGRRVTAVVQERLVAHADGRLLRIVLENLLGNAWKFTAKKGEARIEVGVEPRDADLAYFVRDNGAGFDMAFASRLFAPFQRLHTTDEFPGTGVGLATVHRIIGRHGGRVWAEGAVDRGAAIFFTLSSGVP